MLRVVVKLDNFWNLCLLGKGVPFHAEGTNPKAPCPICLNQKGDAKPRRLFAIHGREKGNHDPVIPTKFFGPVIDELDDSDQTGAALKVSMSFITGHADSASSSSWPLHDLRR
jgi:hypothetical protein